MKLSIRDETASGKTIHESVLEFESEIVTVKDIITERVLLEVATYNSLHPEYFNGLVQPTEAEQSLNGYKLKPDRKIDGEKQVYIALDAFQKNSYFLLIDDVQSESLEQEIQLKNNPVISFIKLTPLIGG